MQLLAFLFKPGMIGMLALFLAVVWMLRDERDRERPLLVFALALNLFFGFFMTIAMAREGGMLPFKYDHVLFRMDAALGVSAAAIARPLQGFWRIPLVVVYQSMVPMMIVWFFVTRYRNPRGRVLLAYVAELVGGPVSYMIVPACGPIYAFAAQWLHPPAVQPDPIRLMGLPNAFPSLHMGTAFVLLLFAPSKLWRSVAAAFLAGTALATISTGEHFVIDLAPGLLFGCFAASVGFRQFRKACLYLGGVWTWSFTVRLGYPTLLAHPAAVLAGTVLTVALAVHAVWRSWTVPALEPVAAEIPATQ